MLTDILNQSTRPADKIKGWPWTLNNAPVIYDPAIAWPKISIVTPSFNQGSYIEETIRSVLLQNYPNLEYVIIDGGSTDETINIIKKYEPWISYWVSEPDKGQSHAINKGIEKCTGDIFNWLNSDDWYMPDTFLEIASHFLANPALQFLSGFENHIGMNGSITVWTGTSPEEKLEQTIEVCELTQPSTFFKLETIRKVNGVPEDMHYIMDGELWVKLLLWYGQQGFLKIKKVLVNFRFHENSKSVSNIQVNNFLLERASIIVDLQHYIGLPEKIIDYYTEKIYQNAEVYRLNRNWQFNSRIISKRKLKIHFIQKYVMKQFMGGNRNNARWGIIQLVKIGAFDFYLLKSLLKLVANKRD